MVIPIYDVNPVRRRPWVTYTLIGTNVVFLLLTPLFTQVGAGQESVADICRQAAFFQHFAVIPHELVTNHQLPLVATGGVTPDGTACLIGPAGYTKIPALSVLIAMFLHGGWLHLLGNMLFLWVFGNNIEDRLGHLGYLLFYLVTGYAAAYGFALANAGSVEPLVGASGAISGVLGAYLVLYPKVRVWSLVPILFFIPLRLPAWLVLGMWFILQWVYSSGLAVAEGGEVAYLAHVIGFVLGAVVALPFRNRTPRREQDRFNIKTA
ncbi:rhomboid family intramembrane serine protease [Hamadaea tsunoensis]|uniref:rhomboid family intramembrane serine protease n=1 Tax=Hamadaea tsunoensis TaxID=53368 RepID=UPI0006847300|nr:rhomboid family intramembrane serine protease [Hamadaea tsunoensis]